MVEPKKKSKSKSKANVPAESIESSTNDSAASSAISETPGPLPNEPAHSGAQGLTPAQLGRLISGFILIAIGAATFFRYFSQGPQGLPASGLPATTTAEWIISLVMLVIFALIPIGVGCWLIFFNLNHVPTSRRESRGT
jgi:hypothetical protein